MLWSEERRGEEERKGREKKTLPSSLSLSLPSRARASGTKKQLTLSSYDNPIIIQHHECIFPRARRPPSS